MGELVVLKTGFRGRREECEPRVRAKLHGWAAMAKAGLLTEPDWEAINRQRATCARCGSCPDLAARLMVPPMRMAMQPAAPAGEPVQPVLRMS
jgi:hypothetical protein